MNIVCACKQSSIKFVNVFEVRALCINHIYKDKNFDTFIMQGLLYMLKCIALPFFLEFIMWKEDSEFLYGCSVD